MANSKYDYHKEDEKNAESKFPANLYIIVRLDGDKFHRFCTEHKFDKPNDKRALDLMVASAKHLMQTFKGHVPLAYGHSDEFSFMIRKTSNLLTRRPFKITSMFASIFTAYYNSNWDRYFRESKQGAQVARKYDAWFDAKPNLYGDYDAVINYFRWRQVDCHINNLYNTTLHTLTGRYVRHELVAADESSSSSSSSGSSECLDLFTNGSEDGKMYELRKTPIRQWITDPSKFLTGSEATQRLSGTVSSDKHDIMFLDFQINYNNELEQFKKGTVVVDTQRNFEGSNADPDAIRHFNLELIKNEKFWRKYNHIFDDLKHLPID